MCRTRWTSAARFRRLPEEGRKMDAVSSKPELEEVDYLPALEAALRYFGKSVDRDALLAGLPLKGGQLGAAHVAEAASRAEIIAVEAVKPASALTRTEMPALAVSIVDGPVALLMRRGSGFMAAQAQS